MACRSDAMPCRGRYVDSDGTSASIWGINAGRSISTVCHSTSRSMSKYAWTNLWRMAMICAQGIDGATCLVESLTWRAASPTISIAFVSARTSPSSSSRSRRVRPPASLNAVEGSLAAVSNHLIAFVSARTSPSSSSRSRRVRPPEMRSLRPACQRRSSSYAFILDLGLIEYLLAEAPAHVPRGAKVHPPPEHVTQIQLHPRDTQEAGRSPLLELHEQVDVAIRPKVGTQGRSENGKPPDPPASTERSKTGLWDRYLWVHFNHPVSSTVVALDHQIRVDVKPALFISLTSLCFHPPSSSILMYNTPS